MCYARRFVFENFLRLKTDNILEENETPMIVVDKSWGWEKWFADNSLYFGKCLYVKKGKWSSFGNFHYHKIKDETFFVISGKLHLEYVIETEKEMEILTLILNKGDSFRVKPGVKHRFTSTSFLGCKFIEASTTHRDEDSYRCYWDENGNKWVLV